MKICYFYTDITLRGGIERVLSLLTSAQANDKDLDITIVSQYKTFEEPLYQFPGSVKYVYLKKSSYGGYPSSIFRLKLLLKNIFRIRNFFHKNNFDIILSQAFPNTFMLFLSGIKISKVVSVEHTYYAYYNSGIRLLRNVIYKRCNAVVVLTNTDRKFFTKYLNKVYTIPNPVSLSNRKYSESLDGRIISVGRLEYEKGYDVLIRIFSQIHKKYPNWILDIYGEGTLKEQLQNLIAHEGLNSFVNLRGVTNQVLEEMHCSSFFVSSSRFEGFSMVLVEAMSQGLPCVSFNCPNGPADIINNGENGILVPNQDEDALCRAIERLIENRDLRIKMGKSAYASIEKFDVNIIVDQWKRLYYSRI